MRVSVYGAGLTGLVTAWALADVGNDVVLVACEGEELTALKRLQLGVNEPGLSERLAAQLAEGRLRFEDQWAAGFNHGDVHFVALAADRIALAEQLLAALALTRSESLTVVNQSTFPVGAARRLRELMLLERERQGLVDDVYFLALPSFLQEGAAIHNFTRPQRILLGSDDEWGLRLVAELLRPFCRNQGQLMVMSTKEAEFSKYAINGMLATKLSFMNEMANLADQLQVDIEQVRKGVGSDPRIGFDYIYPGCGFGGLSFSQDVMRLAETVETEVEDSYLLQTVLESNEQQKEVLFRKLWRHFDSDLAGKTVAIWGAAFKPGTDRIDNAPCLLLLEALWAQGVAVRIYDPAALESLRRHFGERQDMRLCDSAYQAAEGADALLIVTEWKEFWSPDFERLAELMRNPLIFDGRNIYDPGFMREIGFTYRGVGRSSDFDS
ncbi:UDP-glucose dehydrogenase family protein [Motiliproteus sediminis]|uniref:UDP-glucose dehydrogenase family protein n=1 Tax=Motiliproteus sediminis TaxID=1468178 RepID=UPI001AEF3B62|nr:nucleotide sugar dehydrogenase [Motiliproteus sediminis]